MRDIEVIQKEINTKELELESLRSEYYYTLNPGYEEIHTFLRNNQFCKEDIYCDDIWNKKLTDNFYLLVYLYEDQVQLKYNYYHKHQPVNCSYIESDDGLLVEKVIKEIEYVILNANIIERSLENE